MDPAQHGWHLQAYKALCEFPACHLSWTFWMVMHDETLGCSIILRDDQEPNICEVCMASCPML